MESSNDFDPTTTSVFGMTASDEAFEAPAMLSARDRDAVDALPADSALLIVQRAH